MDFDTTSYGKANIKKLLKFCALEIEAWQVENVLNEQHNKIPVYASFIAQRVVLKFKSLAYLVLFPPQ
jgi:hypothetical protein